MHLGSVDPHIKAVISLVSQISCFNTVPGIGSQLWTTEPLAHFGSDVITGDMIGSQHPFDLPNANFIIGIRCFLDTKNMFVVVTGNIPHGLAHVDVSTGVKALCTSRKRADKLCRSGTTFEVD